MSNPLDTDAGSELFESYSAEFRLVEADLAQKLDTIPELAGEPRKAAISQAERALEEAEELVRGKKEKHEYSSEGNRERGNTGRRTRKRTKNWQAPRRLHSC